MQYVGFWPRVGAEIMDGLITGLASFILVFILALALPESMHGMLPLMGYIIYPIYSAYFVSSDYMATPGKMAIGAIVTKPDGTRLSFPNALGRALAKYVSAFLLLIGYIIVAFTEKKQGLHDFMATTVVIKKGTRPEPAEQAPANPMSQQMGGPL